MRDPATNRNRVRVFFESTTNQFLTALSALIVGSVCAMLTWGARQFQDMVYSENIGIGQIVHADENHPTAIKIALTDLSKGVGISGGRLTLTPMDDSIILNGSRTFTFASTPGSTDVAPVEGLSIQTLTLADSQISVDLQTNKGKAFRGAILIKSTARRPSTSVADLSGHWRFMLNHMEGDFDLKEKKYRFTVTGKLDEGPRFTGAGWRDGTMFRLTLNADDHKSYSTVGIYCQVKTDGASFEVVNSRVTTRMNGILLGEKVPLKAIIQRCPEFPSLTEFDGDGIFMATVPLGQVPAQ